MASSIVDSPTTLISLLDTLDNQPTSPPSLYLDLEGTNLSRHGSISIIEFYVLPHNNVYLIDIHILGEEAFSTQNSVGRTLKAVLESPNIPKVFFDVRNDFDALYSHFQINLAGVQDIQLFENATRSFNRRCVNGLGKCIEKDISMTYAQKSNWKTVKDQCKKLFAPEQGGSYEIFNKRPLVGEIRNYCVQDVLFLPALYNTYSAKVSAEWAEKVRVETLARVALSQTPGYNGKGSHKALGPWP